MTDKSKTNWYCKTESTEFGPMAAKALRKLIEKRALKPTDFVRRGEKSAWTEAQKVPALSQFFERAATVDHVVTTVDETDDVSSSEPEDREEPPDFDDGIDLQRLIIRVGLALGAVFIAYLWFGDRIATQFLDPAHSFEDFKQCINVENFSHYYSVTTNEKFPTGDVVWEGTLQHQQMAGAESWLLHFKDVSLPKPLELRFLCSSDEAIDWVPYIGKKTQFRGKLSNSLVAGYGGPRMFSGGSPKDVGIVFDLFERFSLEPARVIYVSQTKLTGQRTIANHVPLAAMLIQIHDVVPTAKATAKSDHAATVDAKAEPIPDSKPPEPE